MCVLPYVSYTDCTRLADKSLLSIRFDLDKKRASFYKQHVWEFISMADILMGYNL